MCSSVVAVNTCDQYHTHFMDTLANSYVYSLKFQVWKHDMPCAVEINNNGRFKQEHLESCFSTKKKYLYYHNSHDHQTWQGGDSQLVDPTHNVTWLIGQHKTEYLYYQSGYGYQTWQNDDLLWWAPTQKVTWHFGYWVLQNNLTNYDHYISTTTVGMTTRPCRMVMTHGSSQVVM